MRKLLLALVLSISAMASTYAVDLMDIYEQALDNDPEFKNAYDIYMANKENIPIAFSALYPQVYAGASIARNVLDVAVASNIGNVGTFNSYAWTVTASQTVFNVQAWMLVTQARASVKAALAQFNDAAQNLILRTARAYFSILLAKDTLDFAQAKKRANQRQLDQAKQRFEVGLDAITSVYEAKAAYDQSVAEVIQARNNQINQNENLRKLTNHTYEQLAPLRDGRIPLVKPEPDNVNEWVDKGLQQNYLLLAAKYNFEAARDYIRVQNGGHLPTIALQSNTQNIRNVEGTGGSFFAPRKQLTTNLMLAFNFPIFQGGLVEANVRQAQYQYQSSGEQLEKTSRDVVVNSRIAFNTITDGISKVKADRETVISQRQSLESTEAQFQVGTRTMVDVVNAQQRLFEAQRQLATDQYDLLLAILDLKYLAGTLNVNDLEQINAVLATMRINGFAPDPQADKISK
ncbi:MAG: TolC family outer membrane protein [Legionellaceae bacterium]|nr:TolC family outer membrane protein [Legionellaceae bacterium]